VTETTKTVRLTREERFLILDALRIASEDGPIYGGAEADEEYAKINDEIEVIKAKLS